LSEFRQRVEAAIPALRRYARALTRDGETADDIVQDTLVRALRSEHLFHDGDVRAWLYTILTNLNRNRLRSLSRRPTLTPIKDSDAAMTGPDTGSRDIARALDDLAEDQRAALLLGMAVADEPVATEPNVGQHRLLPDNEDLLKDCGYPDRLSVTGRAERLERGAIELDRPGIWGVHAGEDLHQRALAGCVLPHDRENLAASQFE